MEFFDQFRGLLGIALMVLLAWAISEDRSARPTWRWIAGALALQAGLALLIVRVPFVWDAVTLANEAVAAIERATLDGSSYMFGYLGGAPLPFDLAQGAEAPVIIAFQILPLVIVFRRWPRCCGTGGCCAGWSMACPSCCGARLGSAAWSVCRAGRTCFSAWWKARWWCAPISRE